MSAISEYISGMPVRERLRRLRAIQRVLGIHIADGPLTADKTPAHIKKREARQIQPWKPTEKGKQILDLRAQGFTQNKIADKLGTATSYVYRVLTKAKQEAARGH